MKIYSITDARKILGELINQVKYQKSVIALGRNGKADVLIIALPGDEEHLPIEEINAQSASFDFLAEEPDLYSVDDLKKRYG